MIFIWWKLKMSYHTAYPNWDSQAVVCHLFLYSFICAATNAFTWLSKFCTIQISNVFYLSWELSWCRASVLKGDLQFSKFFKNTICIGLCKLKCTEKRFIPLTPLLFLPEFVPHTEFKGRPEMPSRMYSTIQLLEIMRRSAFTSPLSYPFLLDADSKWVH